MANLELRFVDGLFWKTLALGGLTAGLSLLLMTPYFAGSVLLGVFVSAFNLRVVAWVSRKMVGAAQSGDTGTSKWSALLVIKLFLLFALTYIFIVVLGAHVVGFIVGYSIFLLAIVWQSILHLRDLDEEEEGEAEPTDDQDIERR